MEKIPDRGSFFPEGGLAVQAFFQRLQKGRLGIRLRAGGHFIVGEIKAPACQIDLPILG